MHHRGHDHLMDIELPIFVLITFRKWNDVAYDNYSSHVGLITCFSTVRRKCKWPPRECLTIINVIACW